MWVIIMVTHHTLGLCHAHGPLFPSAWEGSVALPRLVSECMGTLGPGVQLGRQDKGVAGYPSPERTCKK